MNASHFPPSGSSYLPCPSSLVLKGERPRSAALECSVPLRNTARGRMTVFTIVEVLLAAVLLLPLPGVQAITSDGARGAPSGSDGGATRVDRGVAHPAEVAPESEESLVDFRAVAPWVCNCPVAMLRHAR
jgi:hypothetical protein